MKPAICTLIVACACSLIVADDRVVIVPKDDQPFTVKTGDVVRVSEKGISGSKIEAKVDGPAKIENTNTVRELRGGKGVLGSTVKEFEVKPTGTGKVTVTITVTPPQPSALPKKSAYEFEVK
jgi:uncharacterized cupredoxin-like copper-binding protein